MSYNLDEVKLSSASIYNTRNTPITINLPSLEPSNLRDVDPEPIGIGTSFVPPRPAQLRLSHGEPESIDIDEDTQHCINALREIVISEIKRMLGENVTVEVGINIHR